MPERWVNPEGWGSPPAPRPRRRPSDRHPGRRRWYGALAAASVLLGVVAIGRGNGADAPDSAPAPTTSSALPKVTTSTAPPTTAPAVEVPNLDGMELATAKGALADLGLRVRVRYRTTARHPAGTVISQSRTTGAGVRPGSRITVVVAKAPPPPPTTAPPSPTTTAPQRDCDPSYPDVCLDPDAGDYDCAGGSGNGPAYVEGPVRVRPPDPFDLDREGDGWGCESG